MTTLADKAILSGADNCPPMLEKDMYDFWKSIMELYMMNRQDGRMILEYAPTVNQQHQQLEFPQLDSGLTILVFKQGDDPIDAINHIMSFLSAVVTSRYPTTNNQLRNSTYTPGASGSNSTGKQMTVICYNYKGEGHMSKQCTKPKRRRDDLWFKDKVLLNDQQLEPKLYDGNVIRNTSAFVFPDLRIRTLMLAEESRSKMLLKQQVPMVLEKKVNTTPVDYAVLNQLSQDFEKQFVLQTELSIEQAFWSHNSMNSSDPNPSCRPIKVEVPKELPKVSMVNTSLKKLKHHLAGFDVVVKERTTATAITKGSWGHTQEQAAILKEVVEQGKSQNPLNNFLDSVFKYTKRIQELHIIIRQTFPSINNSSDKLVALNPKCKDKTVRFTEPITSSGNTNTKTASSSNLVSNKPMLFSIGIKPSTSAIGSQPSGNTKKYKIQLTPSSTQKNKVEAHLKIVKSSLKNKNCFVEPKGNENVQHSKLNVNYELLCKSSKRKVWKPTEKEFTNIGYTWRPVGQTFNIVRNVCPLTRITITAEVPLRKLTALESDTPKPVVILVYSRKPKKYKTNVPLSKPKIIKSISANKKEPSKPWESIVSDVPSSSLDECRSFKMFSGVVRFGKKGKLAPRFVRPFEITERIGPVAYRQRLPQELNDVHDTFHVSNLKKCLADQTLHVLLEEIQVDVKLNFMEEPVEILEREFKKLKRSRIPIVKV
ncbi:hypothetical protein Tco_1028891 [Tanacetum coccineum]|uniref:Tf2-1-like SH3-like domain-containing protein n=1 Tax=Tanacetum coccineum TaxID=301880 RepID=A0ABQ5G1W5_9ASTR